MPLLQFGSHMIMAMYSYDSEHSANLLEFRTFSFLRLYCANYYNFYPDLWTLCLETYAVSRPIAHDCRLSLTRCYSVMSFKFSYLSKQCLTFLIFPWLFHRLLHCSSLCEVYQFKAALKINSKYKICLWHNIWVIND